MAWFAGSDLEVRHRSPPAFADGRLSSSDGGWSIGGDPLLARTFCRLSLRADAGRCPQVAVGLHGLRQTPKFPLRLGGVCGHLRSRPPILLKAGPRCSDSAAGRCGAESWLCLPVRSANKSPSAGQNEHGLLKSSFKSAVSNCGNIGEKATLQRRISCGGGGHFIFYSCLNTCLVGKDRAREGKKKSN